MKILYDVWSNVFEKEIEVLVPEFFEWKKDDNIELYDQIPLLKLGKKEYLSIANTMNKIPDEILNQVYQKSYKRMNRERKYVDYAFVMTDGTVSLLIDTEGTEYPKKKSKLIPRTDCYIVEIQEELEIVEFEVKDVLQKDITAYYGLTRREKEIKNLLDEMVTLLKDDSDEKIRYAVSELNNDIHYIELKNYSKKELLEILKETFTGRWTKKHSETMEILINGNEKAKEKYKEIQKIVERLVKK